MAWTRARYGRIVIGDRSTLEGVNSETRARLASGGNQDAAADAENLRASEIWKTALKDCEEVKAEDIGADPDPV